MTDLRLRASQAFDAEFRDRLANAVQVALLRGDNVGSSPPWCRCPLGCLTVGSRPGSEYLHANFGFSRLQFIDFIGSFECRANYDTGTPEAALGLLYRERLMQREVSKP